MSRKTILVLGAGASKEVGLPIGNELTINISKLLDIEGDYSNRVKKGDPLIYEALNAHSHAADNNGSMNDYLRAARHTSEAMPQAESIDNFIHVHRGDNRIEMCGKLGIIRSILIAERKSSLYFGQAQRKRKIDFSQLNDVWLSKLFKLLTNNCTVNELEGRLGQLSLIVFNYDRCLEHYLYHALQNFYRITNTVAADLVNAIEIFHPYGVVGYLPWQGKGKSIEFGVEPTSNQLLELSTEIKTFTEGMDPYSQDLLLIKRNMLLSHRIIFLGFAFHDLNMGLLKQNEEDDVKPRLKQYFATAKGLSDSNIEIIESDIKGLYPKDSNVVNISNKLTCSELFDEYSLSLRFK